MAVARGMRRGAAWLVAAACLAGCAGAAPQRAAIAQDAAPASRLILLVGTGLDAKTLALARSAAGRDGGALAIDSLPAHVAIAPVADRAARMRALMSGAKACAAGGATPPTLIERARGAGYAAGIVTTARLTGPVPAAAYSHACHAAENALAAMLVPGGPGYNPALGANGLDLAWGGGRLYFLPPPLGGRRDDGRQLIDELRAREFRLIENIAGFRALDAAPPERVVGLFAWDHVSDEADRDGAAEPSLAQMTGKAMALLSRNARGYVLTVEGGQIGALMQEGDAARAAIEAIAFDDALRVARAGAESADPRLAHTLIVLIGDDFAAALGAGAKEIAGARDWSGVQRLLARGMTGADGAEPDAAAGEGR